MKSSDRGSTIEVKMSNKKRNLTSQPIKLEKIEGNVEFESEPRENDDKEIDLNKI